LIKSGRLRPDEAVKVENRQRLFLLQKLKNLFLIFSLSSKKRSLLLVLTFLIHISVMKTTRREAGATTIECCAHAASIIWYLAFARHNNFIPPTGRCRINQAIAESVMDSDDDTSDDD
jgi:hypothetical protein